MGKEVVADPRYEQCVEELNCDTRYPFRIPITDNLSFTGLVNSVCNSLREINETCDLDVKVTGINEYGPGVSYTERVFTVDVCGRYNLMVTLIQHSGGETFWGDIIFEKRKDVLGKKITGLDFKIYDAFLSPENKLGLEFLSLD